MKSTMHIGLADFAEPTLLIIGEAASLNWLADCLGTRQSIDLATAPSVRLVRIDMIIAATDDECSLSRNGRLFKWKVSPLGARQFAEQLRAVAVSEKPAHMYLDVYANNAGVQVIASKGEYTADVFSI